LFKIIFLFAVIHISPKLPGVGNQNQFFGGSVMNKVLFSLFLSCLGFSAFATNVEFKGRCTVLQQSTKTGTGNLLAVVQVSLKPGETQTIYKQDNIIYEVSLRADSGPSNPKLYVLQTTITYGDPNFLANAQASYSESDIISGPIAGVGVALPGFPSFGCGRP
jgi:hypothetical protein